MSVPTQRQPDDAQWRDLLVAWRVCRHVKSNAIVIVSDGMAVGVGAGQMSRVEAAELAVQRAGDRVAGAVAASDAFFPMPDGLETLGKAGIVAVIQPGGSKKDPEVTAAADALGMAMVHAGERHFRALSRARSAPAPKAACLLRPPLGGDIHEAVRARVEQLATGARQGPEGHVAEGPADRDPRHARLGELRHRAAARAAPAR